MPVIEVRPVRDQAEHADFRRMVRYVFANNTPDAEDSEGAGIREEWTHCVFEDGRLVTSMAALPFQMRLNGAVVRMAGVTCVGTSPAARRRGYLRQAMASALPRWRDEGAAFAILWASMGAIYQRFGYGLASTFVRYQFNPHDIAFAVREPSPGTVELVDAAAAIETLEEVYTRFSEPRNMMIRRARSIWNLNALQPAEKGHPVYALIYRDEEGQAQGYLVYRQREDDLGGPGPSIAITVRDFAWTSMDAYRALWETLAGHDLAYKVTWRGVAEDDPAPHLLLEPRMLNRWTGDGIWMRVLDAGKALEQRPFSDAGELALEVAGDEMCPWNNGTYVVEAGEGTASVSRASSTAGLRLGPNALASLISGHASATQLARMGLLEVLDPAAARIADRMFATAFRPHCSDDF